jgi:hypothetical protein
MTFAFRPSSILMAIAVAAITGRLIASSTAAERMSNARTQNWRTASLRNPSLKIIQLGFSRLR